MKICTCRKMRYTAACQFAVLLVSALLLSNAVVIDTVALVGLALRFLRMRQVVEAARTSAYKQSVFGILTLLPGTIHAHLLRCLSLDL